MTTPRAHGASASDVTSVPRGYSPSASLPTKYAETEPVVLVNIQHTVQVLRRLLTTQGILSNLFVPTSRKRVKASLTEAIAPRSQDKGAQESTMKWLWLIPLRSATFTARKLLYVSGSLAYCSRNLIITGARTPRLANEIAPKTVHHSGGGNFGSASSAVASTFSPQSERHSLSRYSS